MRIDGAATDKGDAHGSLRQMKNGDHLVGYQLHMGMDTCRIAELIAQKIGGDPFEIATVNPYTDDYNELLDIA